MDEINERRLRKEGHVSPAELTKHILKMIEAGEIEEIVYVIKTTEGAVSAGWSNVRTVNAVGLLEIGKQDVIDHMKS